MEATIQKIRNLVGNITEEQLRYVDCFVGDNIGLFMPSVGPCFYATTPLHTHPAYCFVLTFDDYCQLKIDEQRRVINTCWA